MNTLPWIHADLPQFRQLVDGANGTKLLIDTQRKNADVMAGLWSAYQLCLSPQKPCGQCQSCHLHAQLTHPDHIFHAEMCNIEQIRQLIAQVHTTPTIAPFRAVYLGRIDQYNPHALNALLKTLEEPPTHSAFLLSAASRRAVMPTVLSRAQVINMAKPTHAQSMQWLVDEHQIAHSQAEQRLQIHADNPFAALANKTLPTIETTMEACVAFMADPNRHSSYLMTLEQLPSDSVIDFVSAQIAQIIHLLHFNDQAEALYSPTYAQYLAKLDLVNLHTLYAKLSTLRRPDKQQINALLSVKSLLLQSMKQRSLSI